MIIYTCRGCESEFLDDPDYLYSDCPFCGSIILSVSYYDTDTIDTLDDERIITLKDYEGE